MLWQMPWARAQFVNPLAQRLLSEPYTELLKQVCDVKNVSVQDAFCLTCLPQSLDGQPVSDTVDVSLTDDVSSLLSSLSDWDFAPRKCAMSMADHLTTLQTPGHEVFPALSEADLLSHQKQDPAISRVAYYVEWKCRPSRHKRYHDTQALSVTKHWEFWNSGTSSCSLIAFSTEWQIIHQQDTKGSSLLCLTPWNQRFWHSHAKTRPLGKWLKRLWVEFCWVWLSLAYSLWPASKFWERVGCWAFGVEQCQ